MKRPQPPGAGPRPSVEHDIKKALTPEQLAEIGAISLKFNQIESLLEFMLIVVLQPPAGLSWELVRRINGIDNKISILRAYYESNKILTDEAKHALKLTLDGVSDYKGYRDLIIHCVPYDAGIGQHITTKAKAMQILLTMDALVALYERMSVLHQEMAYADLLFRLGSEEGAKAIYRGSRDPSRLRRERDVPAVLALVLHYQNRRLSLLPLPEFPSDEEIRASREAAAKEAIPIESLFPRPSSEPEDDP